MKLIIALLLSFNVLAEYKMEISSKPNVVGGQSSVFDTEQEAKDRLKEIAKMKKGWRKGEFTLVEADSLFSEVFTTCENIPDGEPVMRDIYNEQDEVMGQEEYQPLKEVCTDITKYYHPTNWSYSIAGITAEMQAERDAEAIKDARKEELKLKDKEIKLDELVELLQLKGLI